MTQLLIVKGIKYIKCILKQLHGAIILYSVWDLAPIASSWSKSASDAHFLSIKY